MFHSLLTSFSVCLRTTAAKRREQGRAQGFRRCRNDAEAIDTPRKTTSYVVNDPEFARPGLYTRLYAATDRSGHAGKKARARWIPDKYEQSYQSDDLIPNPKIEFYYSLLGLSRS